MTRTRSQIDPRRLRRKPAVTRTAAALLAGAVIGMPAVAAPESAGNARAPAAATPAADRAAPEPADNAAKSPAERVPVNISAAQAARSARHEYGGKILGVLLEADTAKPYYRVKLLSNGRVRVVHVTAHKSP